MQRPSCSGSRCPFHRPAFSTPHLRGLCPLTDGRPGRWREAANGATGRRVRQPAARCPPTPSPSLSPGLLLLPLPCPSPLPPSTSPRPASLSRSTPRSRSRPARSRMRSSRTSSSSRTAPPPCVSPRLASLALAVLQQQRDAGPADRHLRVPACRSPASSSTSSRATATTSTRSGSSSTTRRPQPCLRASPSVPSALLAAPRGLRPRSLAVRLASLLLSTRAASAVGERPDRGRLCSSGALGADATLAPPSTLAPLAPGRQPHQGPRAHHLLGQVQGHHREVRLPARPLTLGRPGGLARAPNWPPSSLLRTPFADRALASLRLPPGICRLWLNYASFL